MSSEALRLAEHIHGHAGWLAAALLCHPAWVLRKPKRKADLAVGLSTGGVTLVFAIGALLYKDYREKVKTPIFQHAPSVGYLFERKEHLAFGALLLAWAGAIAYLAARPAPEKRPQIRRIAHRAFVASAALALATAALGTAVASYRTF